MSRGPTNAEPEAIIASATRRLGLTDRLARDPAGFAPPNADDRLHPLEAMRAVRRVDRFELVVHVPRMPLLAIEQKTTKCFRLGASYAVMICCDDLLLCIRTSVTVLYQ